MCSCFGQAIPINFGNLSRSSTTVALMTCISVLMWRCQMQILKQYPRYAWLKWGGSASWNHWLLFLCYLYLCILRKPMMATRILFQFYFGWFVRSRVGWVALTNRFFLTGSRLEATHLSGASAEGASGQSSTFSCAAARSLTQHEAFGISDDLWQQWGAVIISPWNVKHFGLSSILHSRWNIMHSIKYCH